MSWTASRVWVCAMFAVVAACGDDGPRESFVSVPDGSDGDGDGDDDGGGADVRRGYERFCTEYGSRACADADYQPARECYNDVCEPQYEECDKPCGDFIRCLDACDCTDRRCVSLCEVSSMCSTCRELSKCDPTNICEPLLPACAFEVPERSCAELEACCPDLRGEPQADCESTAESDDVEACSLAYLSYCEQPS